MLKAISDDDRQLLTELDFSARAPLVDLASRLGLSKQTLNYRLRALSEQGVLKGYYPLIDCRRLGFHYCRLWIRCNRRDPKFIASLHRYIRSHPSLFWAHRLGGSFDYLLVYWARRLSDFQADVEDLLGRFEGMIEERLENVITNVVHLSYRFSKLTSPRRTFELKEQDTWEAIDPLDQRILVSLARNSRTSNAGIAQECKSSPGIVNRRIDSLQSRGIIAGYRPIVDFNAMGLSYVKLFLRVAHENKTRLEEFQQYLRSLPEVIYLVYGIGIPSDFDIEVLVESHEALFSFIDSLTQKFPSLIKNYHYLIFNELLKVNYFPGVLK